jgi:hypothetical protein
MDIPTESRIIFCLLGTLRYQESERMIWLDAFSISQSDISEQNQQTLLMNTIYNFNSGGVAIWLGEINLFTLRNTPCVLLLKSIDTFLNEISFLFTIKICSVGYSSQPTHSSPTIPLMLSTIHSSPP